MDTHTIKQAIVNTTIATSYTLFLGIVRSLILPTADPTHLKVIKHEDEDEDNNGGGFERVVHGDFSQFAVVCLDD